MENASNGILLNLFVLQMHSVNPTENKIVAKPV